MSMITVVTACLWLFLVSSFTGANEADVNCLRTIKSQVEDPNRYLSSWYFGNDTAGFICKFIGVTCWHDDENRVLSINLSGYGLGGEFPRGIKECCDLTGLDLSKNNFSGALPPDIYRIIPLVTTLDLSSNRFSGGIPFSISKITFLSTLMLQQNQFTGPLHPQLVLLVRLNKFSVADNLLVGPVPNFNKSLNVGEESFARNLDLCGPPLQAACVDAEEEEMIRSGEMGAAVGAALFAPIGASLGWFFFNRKKEKRGDIERRRSLIFHIGD